ncbi:MAG: DUF21 domain-containing protein [Alphaproteobacteria bacterium]|nr:DUF21 domain-containing protein [Alphaproteobacteria bacterium]
MVSNLFYFILVVALLLIGSYFSACETALTAYSKPKMFSIAKEGNKKAQVIISLQPNISLVLSTILTCYTILNSLIVSVSNVLCINVFGDSAVFYGPIIVSIFIVLFAEVLPKMLTITSPEKILLPSAYFIKYLYLILKPVNKVIAFIASKIIKLININSKSIQDTYKESLDELKGAIDLHTGVDMETTKQEKVMLKSILDLGSVPVSSIMIHRNNVTTLCIDDNINTIIDNVMNCPFTRIPLWSDNPDNIIGILHVRDFLKAIREHGAENIKLMDIALKPCFIPENKALLDQLQSFKKNHEHFALVIDEYGCFMGIVTLEDIIEEIVGDISDEHDVVSVSGVRQQKDGSYIVNGSINIRDLNREIESDFKTEDAATIAGFVINSIEIIPDVGQIFIISGYKFEILKKYRNQVTLLKLTKINYGN